MKKKSIFLRVGAVFLTALIATICVLPSFATTYSNSVSFTTLRQGDDIRFSGSRLNFNGLDTGDSWLVELYASGGYGFIVPFGTSYNTYGTFHWSSQSLIYSYSSTKSYGITPTSDIETSNKLYIYYYDVSDVEYVELGFVFEGADYTHRYQPVVKYMLGNLYSASAFIYFDGPPDVYIVAESKRALVPDYEGLWVQGLNEGVAEQQNATQTAVSGIRAVLIGPLQFLEQIFSFELFGINVFATFSAIFTILVVIWVLKKVGLIS